MESLADSIATGASCYLERCQDEQESGDTHIFPRRYPRCEAIRRMVQLDDRTMSKKAEIHIRPCSHSRRYPRFEVLRRMVVC
jgi:hypothetical protein